MRSRLAIALGLVALVLVGRASATVGAYLPLPRLVGYSEVIVSGTVLAQRSVDDAERHHRYTHTTVHVAHYFKGDGPTELIVETLGGPSPRHASTATPTFAIGEDVMLFLHPDDAHGCFHPAGRVQGVFRVRSTSDGPIAFRDLSGMAFAGPSAELAGTETSIRLTDLQTLVTRLVGGAR